MCRHFREDFGLLTRVARFHNVYGPHGTWDGGREKAPAAVCRKVIQALETGNHEIEIWGDGNQTRSFMYIDDCITGINRILYSDIEEPINLGSQRAGDDQRSRRHRRGHRRREAGAEVQPQRAQGGERPQQRQHADPALLGWEPSIRLRDGMEKTFNWIQQEYRNRSELAEAKAN